MERWTSRILLVCIIVFVFQLTIEEFDLLFSFIPAMAIKQPWRFITSIFMHADPAHLFLNMFALLTFGNYLELKIKPKKFLLVFFASGILGNLAYFLTSPTSSIPAVGASGAIFGIIGTLAILYPHLIVYFFYVPMPLVFAAFFWTLISIVGMFIPSQIAHQSHLAGLLFGMIYGYYLKKKASKRKVIYYWYSIS
ncbi:MAG: rhomboid family intramembrane serine protease [Candidatus Aenigmarchaeota archaeon]|nr:rhomboid family intramembrane serine protease [Candidatus Aenigmarchaeota archaeon]